MKVVSLEGGFISCRSADRGEPVVVCGILYGAGPAVAAAKSADERSEQENT